MLKDENIICFAGEDWWYHNPHSNLHIMKSLARTNRVLFVNSIGVRMPSFSQDQFFWKRIKGKLKSLLRYFKKAESNIYVLTPIALPFVAGKEKAINNINTFLLKLQLNIIMFWLKFDRPIVWVTLPTVKDVVLHLRKKKAKCLVYYCVDNVSFYSGANQDYIASLDQLLQKNADISFFVNQKLVKERQHLNPRTFFLSHGVDYDHFASINREDVKEAEDLVSIPRPIVGYMGLIRDLDLKLVSFLAKHNPAVSFVFIGEAYTVLDDFLGIKNIYFLGKKPYEALPRYLKAFSICCLLYKTGDRFNDYRNPKKLLEYLATGIPIVSVNILEMKNFASLVLVAKTYEEFDAHIKRLIKEPDAALKDARQRFAGEHTWDQVAKEASKRIEEVLAHGSAQSKN